MDRQVNKPKPRRKLSKSQIVDILERNVALYKEESSFVHYLVELAVYLMEYEYDWAESSVEPPEMLLHPHSPAEPPPKTLPTPPNNGAAPAKPVIKAVFSQSSQTSVQKQERRKQCPYCGVEVGELLICPSCRNLTR